MASKKKIDKEMGFRLKQARTEQKLTQLSRQTTSTTSGCWFICHNVRKNRLQQSSLLWKPIFGHPRTPKNRISPISVLFREYFWIILNYTNKVARLLSCQPPLCLFAKFFKKFFYAHTFFHDAQSIKNLYTVHNSLIVRPLLLLVMGMIHCVQIVL